MALDTALSELRKVGLASQVLDVSVCGAIEPYNHLLGGKLVAMLLASREVQTALDERYGDSISEIASRLAGRPIIRETSVRVLTTTSLYGVGSSQYNRLKLRANDHRGIRRDLEWVKLAKRGAFEHEGSKGFGTIHLSSATSRVFKELSAIEFGAQRVNNRFDEGASPRLRQVREGLDVLGIQSDQVLNHATPRLVYGLEADEDGRRALLCGCAPSSRTGRSSAADISRAWRRRWLSVRIQSDEVLDRVRASGPERLFSLFRAPPAPPAD